MSGKIPCSRSRPDRRATWVDAAAAQSAPCRCFAADKVNNARSGPAERQPTVIPFGKDGDFMLLKKEKKNTSQDSCCHVFNVVINQGQ